MAVFPVDKMAEKYARSICLRLKDAGAIEDVEACVTKVKDSYKNRLADIDRKWALGLKATYGI